MASSDPKSVLEDIEGDDVLEAGEEGSDDDDEDEDEDADKPLLPGLDEEFILVGLWVSSLPKPHRP